MMHKSINCCFLNRLCHWVDAAETSALSFLSAVQAHIDENSSNIIRKLSISKMECLITS